MQGTQALGIPGTRGAESDISKKQSTRIPTTPRRTLHWPIVLWMDGAIGLDALREAFPKEKAAAIKAIALDEDHRSMLMFAALCLTVCEPTRPSTIRMML